MSRRRRSDDSSLELLLDTICNTFGGVLFLAMLVSLLVQTTRDRAVASTSQDHPPTPAISRADVIRLSSETHEIIDELNRLEGELARVRGFVKEFATPEFEKSLETLQVAQRKQRGLEAHRTELLSAIAAENTAAATAAAAAKASRENATVAVKTSEDVAARLKNAQEKHAALIKSAIALKEKADAKNVIKSTGKAPRERETSKREFGVLMRYGRMYLTHLHGGFGRRVNTKDFVVMSGIGVNKATAKPGAGIDVCGINVDVALQELLSDYPASEWYPCVVVHPDSYDAFQVLKSKLVGKGYEYRVIATDGAVTDQGGHGRVQ